MKLTERKRRMPWYETDAMVRDRGRLRPLMVRITPDGMEMRPKGTRYKLVAGYGWAFSATAFSAAKARASAKNKV